MGQTPQPVQRKPRAVPIGRAPPEMESAMSFAVIPRVPVAVALRDCARARMERPAGFRGAEKANRGRDGYRQQVGSGQRAPDREARDLTLGVHARVGPGGAMHGERFTERHGERVLQRLLDGALARLPLPPSEDRAVIADSQRVGPALHLASLGTIAEVMWAAREAARRRMPTSLIWRCAARRAWPSRRGMRPSSCSESALGHDLFLA